MKIIGSDKDGYSLFKNGEQTKLEGGTRKEALADAVTKGLVAKGQHVRFALAGTRNAHKQARTSNRGN